MDSGVAIDLRSGTQQDPGAYPLGQPEHVNGSVHARLGGLDWVALIEDGRRRAGEVIDLVDLDVQGKGDVVADQLKPRMTEEVDQVVPRARVEVVHDQAVVALLEQPPGQVRPEETRATGNQYALPEGFARTGYKWFRFPRLSPLPAPAPAPPRPL